MEGHYREYRDPTFSPECAAAFRKANTTRVGWAPSEWNDASKWFENGWKARDQIRVILAGARRG